MLRSLSRCSLWRPASALPKWMPRATPSAAGSIFRGALLQPQRQQRRLMATAAPAAAAAPEAPVPWAMDLGVPLTENKGLLGRGHEWYPIVGLGVTTLVTQELWLLDEYWCIGSCFFAGLYVMWTAAADRLEERQRNAWARDLAQTKASFGIRLDFLESYRALESFATSHADDLRAMYAEEKEINVRAVDAANLKTQAATTSLIESRLKLIHTLEADTRTKAINALSIKAAEYVRNKFAESPAAVKSKVVDSAIDRITPSMDIKWIFDTTRARDKPVVVGSNDPVKLLFDDFLSQTRTPEQLGISDGVQRLLAREAAAAGKKNA